MHIKSVRIKQFKRFTDLTIQGLPPMARLVVMIGPNGCGKSSIFDAFKMWHWNLGAPHGAHDPLYHVKQGFALAGWNNLVSIELHEQLPADSDQRKKILYVRSAYRNEADFTTNNLQRMQPAVDTPGVRRLIDNDSSVSQNYQRLVSASVAGLYSRQYDSMNVAELRDKFIGQVRSSMRRVFEELLLKGPGDPLQQGTFYFDKGTTTDFHYKNLSGGEKAAFDILLDLIVKRNDYDDTIFCIDEPEAHMHTRLQGLLLEELYGLIPVNSQLWIATHSIGMMRKAKELQDSHPDSVVFLDFHGIDLDSTIEIEPVPINRRFWSDTLHVALDDLASLIAPRQIVLCEGRSSSKGNNPEFDARCFRIIFSEEFYDTGFISVGSSNDVESDHMELGKSIRALISGAKLFRIVDRDGRTSEEIADCKRLGINVLSRRHLESYLLDDEILEKLCRKHGVEDKLADILMSKKRAIEESVARGNPQDDLKSAAGSIYNDVKNILNLTQPGNNTISFLRDIVAPLVTTDTATYKVLRKDVFNPEEKSATGS